MLATSQDIQMGKWHVAINHNAFPQPQDVGFDWTRHDLGVSRAMKPDRMNDFATKRIDDAYCLDAQGFPRDQTTEDALTFISDQKENPFFLYYATWLDAHTDSDSKQEPSREIYTET